MMDRLRTLLVDREVRPSGGAGPDHGMRLAAAALMVEAARMDDAVDPAERERIAELVRWRFDLDGAEAAALIAEAERVTEGPAQWHAFTSTLNAALSDAERRQIVELLWDVVHADGTVHALEDSLMRRIAGLLAVSDQDSGAARRRARARHGLPDVPAGPADSAAES